MWLSFGAMLLQLRVENREGGVENGEEELTIRGAFAEVRGF
jgi:hypothetical protein